MKNTIKSKKIKYNKTRSKGGASLAISMTDIVRQARKEGKEQAEKELYNTITDLEKMLLDSTMINKQLLANVKELEKENKDQLREYNGLLYDYKHLENKYAATDRWYEKLEKDYKKLKNDYKELEKSISDEHWAQQWEHA
tara:strand:- start:322 stop:741 length:420 start_codon:yes stop_codon:yes gene_type:complete